ncbi:MAG: ABC transporter ATP-binding protein [Spirochaetales bacterium]|nr:ABC transporter ATP-binding protein [Spirochaetales bacterium]
MNETKRNGRDIVAVSRLKKIYRMGPEDVVVLENVNLRVAEGTTVLVLGESGSGKSTLLNLIGGLDSPTDGVIEVSGNRISTVAERHLSGYRNAIIGFIFQFHYLLKDFTALENVMIPALIAGRAAAVARREAAALIAEVGLAHRSDHSPAELSGGERQRAAVARALINSPELILADEPTGNLDERNASVVLALLFDLVRKMKKTMIMVTHDRSVSRKADRSYVLEHGALRDL